ncbi:hypothetical protein ACTOVN_06630 [Arcanobacterium canis]
MSIFTGAGTAVAYADTTPISGDLNTSGSLVKYDYTRTHTFNGSMTIDINGIPSTYLQLGLRKMKIAGGPQIGGTLQWGKKGKHWWTSGAREHVLPFKDEWVRHGSGNTIITGVGRLPTEGVK